MSIVHLYLYSFFPFFFPFRRIRTHELVFRNTLLYRVCHSATKYDAFEYSVFVLIVWSLVSRTWTESPLQFTESVNEKMTAAVLLKAFPDSSRPHRLSSGGV